MAFLAKNKYAVAVHLLVWVNYRRLTSYFLKSIAVAPVRPIYKVVLDNRRSGFIAYV